MKSKIFAVVLAIAMGSTIGTITSVRASVYNGWDNYYGSSWRFYENGQLHKGWLKDKSIWYYFDNYGDMVTGWKNVNETWYYLNPDGSMKTGWLKDGDTWYYLQPSGAMKTGWINDNNVWYYLKESGAMAENQFINNYYLSSNGAWIEEPFTVKTKENEYNAESGLKIEYEVVNNTRLQLDLIPEYSLERYENGSWHKVENKPIESENSTDEPEVRPDVIERDSILPETTETRVLDLYRYDDIRPGTYRLVRDYEIAGSYSITNAKEKGTLTAQFELAEIFV